MLRSMTMNVRTLASGSGWCVRDVVCTAGPHDRPFEERHEAVCIAAVAQGTFQYRSTQGAALLAPGAVLLGNYGGCFACGHDHGVGDRCISVHFTPDYWEDVVADVPGARSTEFAVPRLPPSSSLTRLIASLTAAASHRDETELEELALCFAGAVMAALPSVRRGARPPNRRVERRISDAVRRIDDEGREPAPTRWSLASLAREAAMSPYHFLRVFREVVGMTPHQYVLRTRMHRAALRLRSSDEPVSAIAFDAGFGDLSTFNRRFRRVMGVSPTAYRMRRAS
jgi:AraC family transcriptional regulator